mmetsp:Transcript_10268/g.27258  ORF Transcript_10268/g.27258 Transcript_10268/m.27258 type:complete len:206 (+) Transcript_10268:1085-1702(+)
MKCCFANSMRWSSQFSGVSFVGHDRMSAMTLYVRPTAVCWLASPSTQPFCHHSSCCLSQPVNCLFWSSAFVILRWQPNLGRTSDRRAGAASSGRSSTAPQAWAAPFWRSLRAIESVSQRSPTSCAAPALARTVAGSTFSAAITTKSLPSFSDAACDGLRNAAPAPIFASQSLRWNGFAPMTVIFAPAKQASGGAAVLAFFLGAMS